MAKWVLSIRAMDKSKTWSAIWIRDGEPLATGRFAVGSDRAGELLDDARQHGELFEGGRPITTPGELAGWGRRLHETWFAGHFPDSPGPGTHELWIESDEPRALNLPWELVELTHNLPVGCDPAWSIRRTLPGHLASQSGPLRPGPIRVLVLSAAPTDEGQLDYEREEELILQATSRLSSRTIVHFAETGTFEELALLVAQVEPHIVHLSGHGIVADDGKGYFAFEDDRGHTDPREIEDLAAQVFRGSAVRLVFFNGCETSQAQIAGLCQGAIRAGVPMALGWSKSVGDDAAIGFAKSFYERLARKEPIPLAVSHAAEAIRRSGQLRVNGQIYHDASYSLARLYASDPSGILYDHNVPPVAYDGPAVVYEQLGEGIKGLREGYIGRRRESQRLIPRLRSGETTFAVLTGIGGMGKSTLATRAANRLKGDGFVIIPVKSAPGATPAYAAQMTLNAIVDALIRTFQKANREDLVSGLSAEKLTFRQRLRNAIDGLNEIKALLVLDNFEDVLELETRKVADEDLGWFLGQLALNLVGYSCAIFTCRYFPDDIPRPDDQPNVLDLPVPDFREHDFFKFLRRDKQVEKRIQAGELSGEIQGRLFRSLGGTPGFLLQLRTLLRTADIDELLDELEGGAPGLLDQARQEYLHRILATRLFENLPPEAQRTTCQLALSELPLPLDGVTAIAELDESTALSHLTNALNYGLAQRLDEPELPSLYQCPGILRHWLISCAILDPQMLVVTHRRLGLYWRACYEADREVELRIPIEVELAASREHARQSGDIHTFQWASVFLARPLEQRSQWDNAQALLEEIPEMDRDGITWLNLGSLDANRGNYDLALEKLGRALPMLEAIGNRSAVAATLQQLATIDLDREEFELAAEKLKTALTILESVGDRSIEAAVWHQLASIDLHRKDYDPAVEKLTRALVINEKLGNRVGAAATWHQLASIDLECGDYDAAVNKFALSLELKQACGDLAGESATWMQLAAIAFHTGRRNHAVKLATLALLIAKSVGTAEVATLNQNVAFFSMQSGYLPEQLPAICDEVMAEYQRDRGANLLKQATGREM